MNTILEKNYYNFTTSEVFPRYTFSWLKFHQTLLITKLESGVMIMKLSLNMLEYLRSRKESTIYSMVTKNVYLQYPGNVNSGLLGKTKFSFAEYKITHTLPQNFHFMKFCV